MIVVELLNEVSKRGKVQYQMTSPVIFTQETDPYHRVHLELVTGEERSQLVSRMIKVYIKRKPLKDDNEPLLPSPQVCTVAVSDVSKALASVTSTWFPRLTFASKVPCICGSSCEYHRIAGCAEPQCLHLIKLGK
jgi:hypothetical protein